MPRRQVILEHLSGGKISAAACGLRFFRRVVFDGSISYSDVLSRMTFLRGFFRRVPLSPVTLRIDVFNRTSPVY